MLTDEQIDDLLTNPWLSLPARDSYVAFGRKVESAATAPLLAQIAALEATVRRHEIALLQSVDQLAKVTQLEAQLAEARKDAERYRWLKNECNDKGTTGTYIARELFGFDWNRAIDAVIAQEQ